MKVKDGKAVLSKHDIRIGNFVITKEPNHYKLQDIGGFWSVRISRFLMGYTLIEECLKSDNKEYLEAMIKMYYAITTTPPDQTMLNDMYTAYSALIDRMKKHMPEVTEQEQEEILEEVERNVKNKEILLKEIEDGTPADKKG